jgi:hypothetical protein
MDISQEPSTSVVRVEANSIYVIRLHGVITEKTIILMVSLIYLLYCNQHTHTHTHTHTYLHMCTHTCGLACVRVHTHTHTHTHTFLVRVLSAEHCRWAHYMNLCLILCVLIFVSNHHM